MRIQCPACNTSGTIPDSFIGKRIRCKQCGKQFAAEATSLAEPSTTTASEMKEDPPALLDIPDDIAMAPLPRREMQPTPVVRRTSTGNSAALRQGCYGYCTVSRREKVYESESALLFLYECGNTHDSWQDSDIQSGRTCPKCGGRILSVLD